MYAKLQSNDPNKTQNLCFNSKRKDGNLERCKTILEISS